MQNIAQPLNLIVNMGQDKPNLQNLAEISVSNYSGVQELAKIKAKAKFAQQISQDLVVMFKYFVQPGRELQAQKYLEVGLNEQVTKQLLSPLQFITKKPAQDEGKVQIKTLEGEVQVIYRFFASEINEQFRQIVLSQLSKFHTLNINVSLKGFVKHSLKNRANVKVDYARIQLSANQIDSSIITGIISENQMLPPEVWSNPFFSTIGKVRKFNLTLQYQNFRQINKYYENIVSLQGYHSKKQEKQDFKYINNGLFREKVEAYAFYSDQFSVVGTINHQGQDVFMRLLKVYFKAAKKAFN